MEESGLSVPDSATDLEAVEPLGILPIDVDLPDIGPFRTPATPVDHLFHGVLGPLEDRLDPAIVEVPHPARAAEGEIGRAHV